MHLDVAKLEIPGPADLQGMLGLLLHGMVRNRGEEEPDIVKGNILEIAFRVSQNHTRAVTTSNDVANNHIADRTNGLHRKFRHAGMDFAAAFDVEVKSFSVSPPEPVVEPGLDGQVRKDDIANVAMIEIHESNASIGAGDDAVIDGDLSD